MDHRRRQQDTRNLVPSSKENVWKRLDSDPGTRREQIPPSKRSTDRELAEHSLVRDEAYRKRRYEESFANHKQRQNPKNKVVSHRKIPHHQEPERRALLPRPSDSQRTISDLIRPNQKPSQSHGSPEHHHRRPFRLDMQKKADPLMKGKAIASGEPSDTGSSAKKRLSFDEPSLANPAMAEKEKSISPTVSAQKGEKKKSWYEMVEEEEESEAGNQSQPIEITPPLVNLTTAIDTIAAIDELGNPPTTNPTDLDDVMGEKVIADDENYEDWEDENWGEEDDNQFMEDLLNNDDLLGYDLLCEEQQEPNSSTEIPNLENQVLDEEQEDLEMTTDEMTTDEGITPQTTISPTPHEKPEVLPEENVPLSKTVIDPLIPIKKKCNPQTPRIGFGMKNIVLQGRVSPRGKNKKKSGPKPSPSTQPKSVGPAGISIKQKDSGPLALEEIPNLPP
ncbi:hypothetical protein AALP_AA5G032100 [Arabis alpina]|uniref:Uncharacterized protein n=1 Tax=Arabis alpina TaxID=50452 RepID=A0A087GUM6_ARAAL|nr:hypothetical protein AALP_AA5G032100 [Arabis alpina]